MDNNFNAVSVYRKHVSFLIRSLTYQHRFTLKVIAGYLGLTPAQMSRVASGVCSLSGEKYIILRILAFRYGSVEFLPSWYEKDLQLDEVFKYISQFHLDDDDLPF